MGLIEPDSAATLAGWPPMCEEELEVVTLAFLCEVLDGIAHTSAEATAVAWLTPTEIATLVPKMRAIRVFDALREGGPFVRAHDGFALL